MSDDWPPTATWRALHQRADLKRFVRQFFDERGYVEVDTPLLSADTVVDAHIEPIAVRTGGRDMWLQTSPEFAMKRLLAADCGPIYQLGSAFRKGEAGTRHNPEFTLLEWYRPGDTIEDQISFVTSLLTAVAEAFPSPRLWRTLVPDKEDGLSPERVSYDDAFLRSTGLSGLGANASQLAAALEERGLTPPPGLPVEDAYLDEWRNVTLAELIEPTLGVGRPTFLTDYPASQAALARLKPDDPRVAERFEL
ncbi:MAG: amino acid--tRNA ligase-related protein, partial [Planctomycetota bacterium]